MGPARWRFFVSPRGPRGATRFVSRTLRRLSYAGGGGHGGNAKSSGDTVINNGKYKKACKVNGGNYQDSVSWQATGPNGKIIKSYCPWVFAEGKHRGKYCKQMKNNVLVSTACPCACAGY